jgi:hypothetical protein
MPSLTRRLYFWKATTPWNVARVKRLEIWSERRYVSAANRRLRARTDDPREPSWRTGAAPESAAAGSGPASALSAKTSVRAPVTKPGLLTNASYDLRKVPET